MILIIIEASTKNLISGVINDYSSQVLKFESKTLKKLSLNTTSRSVRTGNTLFDINHLQVLDNLETTPKYKFISFIARNSFQRVLLDWRNTNRW